MISPSSSFSIRFLLARMLSPSSQLSPPSFGRLNRPPPIIRVRPRLANTSRYSRVKTAAGNKKYKANRSPSNASTRAEFVSQPSTTPPLRYSRVHTTTPNSLIPRRRCSARRTGPKKAKTEFLAGLKRVQFKQI